MSLAFRFKARRVKKAPKDGGTIVVTNPGRPKPAMPSLLDRLLGYLTPDESSLAVSPATILAAMREFQRGNLTLPQIESALALTAADSAGLQNVYAQIFVAGTLPLDEFEDLLVLGGTRNRSDPNGQPYYSKATVKTRLGL